jgi:hypothetical protein
MDIIWGTLSGVSNSLKSCTISGREIVVNASFLGCPFDAPQLVG